MIKTKRTYGITKRSFALLIKTLYQYDEIEKAVIFGSRAMGNEKHGSDIDIAVYGSKISADLIRELKVILNEKHNIPYYIDIILFDDISNHELKTHIKNEGKIIFNKRK
jgi:predicted nucleotidyltransferase